MEMEMEMEKEEKVYVHYNHTDPFKHSRWTARESYQFMYDRPWNQVIDFYHDLVNGRSSLSHLLGTQVREFSPLGGYCDDGGENLEYLNQNVPVGNHHKMEKTGRWARATFKIVLSYHGISFDGWQKQPGLNTIQGLVESCLGKFVDEKKAQRLKDKGSAVEGCVVVAGRTDKGVTALCQVCSFYTWRDDVKAHDIEDAINSAAPGAIRVQAISEVPRVFHPNFCARWRRYFYIFPCNNEEESVQCNHNGADIQKISYSKDVLISHDDQLGEKNGKSLGDEDCHEMQNGNKPKNFSISNVDQLLRQLEGKLLSYKMFARDTKASRNEGPPTECFIYHARAIEARLPSFRKGNGEGMKVMCVELVGNRFLRKMVRVLVATSIREAAAGSDVDALISLMDATCRRATAPPAPPEGLCLVDVGYTNFDPQYSLIQ